MLECIIGIGNKKTGFKCKVSYKISTIVYNFKETVLVGSSGKHLIFKAIHFYTGIKRPPALLCTTEDNQDSLADYEILCLEPLHDIKNIINNIFNELCNVIEDQDLKNSVEQHINVLKGKYIAMVANGLLFALQPKTSKCQCNIFDCIQ